jgi:hypothetical protein
MINVGTGMCSSGKLLYCRVGDVEVEQDTVPAGPNRLHLRFGSAHSGPMLRRQVLAVGDEQPVRP